MVEDPNQAKPSLAFAAVVPAALGHRRKILIFPVQSWARPHTRARTLTKRANPALLHSAETLVALIWTLLRAVPKEKLEEPWSMPPTFTVQWRLVSPKISRAPSVWRLGTASPTLNLAEAIMHKACEDRGGEFSQALLDYCGGHADPFHYHERMNCLYTADPATSHSTRIGTAADGNGIYGHNIEAGCEPSDLDWCGGR